MTQPDYLDSHQRHLKDAETLFAGQRYANADHLFGLSAECGLKRLMLCFGMLLDPQGMPPQNDRKHVDKLWARYEAYRSGYVQGTQFPLPPTNPFADWLVDQRYEHQGRFMKALVEPHQKGAQDIATLIQTAHQGGLI